ncbi:MAG: hypothetical protein JWN43_2627 [Gammaproteobacteria bacterium]|nr:hypothetical protein [Gammaproteobacteria bacterium]
MWAWRMDSETATAADRQAFESWLRRDPRHRRASEELCRVWAALNGLADAKRSEKLATFAAAGSPARNRGAWWAAAAASLVLGIAVPALLQRGSELQTLSTAVGQRRNVTLADGSVVVLNTNTIIETNLQRRSREIYLRKGEAHFQVAHDRTRPFLVHAGDAVVRAVGTEFEVRLLSDQHVDIVVNEGRVEVQAKTEEGPQIMGRSVRASVALRALRAGEQLSTATADFAVRAVSSQQLSNDMAWLDGAIIFDAKPLVEAVAEIERYTDYRIVVADSHIATLLVGGRFRTDNVQGFFDALQSALPVSIRRTADGLVYIDPRQ